MEAQNYNWITPGKTYLKLYVIYDGMYRINKIDFTNAGINTSAIDPRTVKVLNGGTQIPIYFSGEQDGIFNDNDYLDFYGMRRKGGLDNVYNSNNQLFYVRNEYYNQYSDTNSYWIEWEGSNGLRYSTSSFTTSMLYPSPFFTDSLHFEKDKLYSQGENVSSTDYRYLNTERFSGEGWYWSILSNNQTLSDTFSIPNLYNVSLNASIKLFAYPQNRGISIANEHTLEVRVNGSLVSTLVKNDFDKFDTTINFSSSVLSNFSVNTISVKYISAPGFDGNIYFDFFELSYPKLFRFESNRLSANLSSADTTSKLFRVSTYNTLNTLNIYDVKNNLRITNFTSSGDTLKFSGKGNGKFELVNDYIRIKPARIKSRQVPDLVSSSNGADYLVIYNSLLQAQAEQLRTYRQSHDNFRSVKSEIEDIYDIFNYGMEDPIAVKRFTKHVYDTWQLPKVKFICLFGRGSLDPKKNLSGSVYEKNLVPVYGNPPSDGYFSNLNVGSFFYYDQIALGRIPAYYPTEAQTMVDKIIAYETEPADKWWKTFSFITGGSTPGEQQFHQQRSNFECSTYVMPPPISGECHKIYRSDSSGQITFNYADSIKNDINRGTLLVNFRGHAGSRDWEVGMQDPNVLSNGNKLPVVLSLTCFTGENSKTEYRGFGEKFMYLNGKGAIGFIGTTGWSFSSTGNDLGTYILQTIKLDSNRRLGEIVKKADKDLSSDSLSFSVRHTVNCYKLMGDPAVKLKLPRIPEFVIRDNDYLLSSESVTLNDPITLTIFPKNFGLYADSCMIRFQLKKNNQNYIIKDTVYHSFRYLDTVLYNFKIDTAGVYSMTVILDQGNWYPLEDKSNNTITFQIPFNEYSFLPLSPVDNSLQYKDSVELTGLNPALNLIQNSVKLMLELDTNKLFNSPVLRTFINNNLSGVSTKFKTRLPVLANNTLYYWRTNAIINNDTTGWSKVQRFIYNNGTSNAETRNEITDENDRFTNADSRIDLLKLKPNQFNSSDFVNTSFTSSGIKLNEFNANLFVRSLGSNAEEASYFSIGDKNIYIDGGQNTGLNLLKVSKITGSILQLKNLKMNSEASSDSLVNILNTYDSTHYLMLLNAAYFAGGTTLSTNARNKLRQFGSIYCDSIGILGYFHSWSLIGYLGAAPSQVSEMFDPCCRTSPACTSCDHWSQSVSSMNVMFQKTSGTVSNIIGPAKEWTQFKWTQSVPANSRLVFDIFGITNAGNQILLRSNIQTNEFVQLSTINVRDYPKLNLLAKFNIDTLTGMQSPVLNSLSVIYSAASELVLDKNSLAINSNQKVNNVLNFSFNFHNAGLNFIYGNIVTVYNGAISDSNVILRDTISSLIMPDSLLHYSNSFSVPVFRDSTRINIYIRPKDGSNEFYTFNNTASFSINTERASAGKKIEVKFDDKVISSGENIRKNPEVKINLASTQKSSLSDDTTQILIRLNERYVPYFINGNVNPNIKQISNDNQVSGNKYSINFYPELNSGKNILSVIYKNEFEDNYDSISYDVFVNGEFSVKDFYNYPNPMRTETSFIFNVEGAASESLFKIKVYTVSGRLIKEIQYNASQGYNQVAWDGRDNDGDLVSNGTYLYKLIMEDKSKNELQVQKLVVLR
ncbi:MAG: C25 family cysteine peptidase [bacterium]